MMDVCNTASYRCTIDGALVATITNANLAADWFTATSGSPIEPAAIAVDLFMGSTFQTVDAAGRVIVVATEFDRADDESTTSGPTGTATTMFDQPRPDGYASGISLDAWHAIIRRGN